MPFTPYRLMTHKQAVDALEEFLTERPIALERLRAELIAYGMDPDALFDVSPTSLTPLWHWIASRRAEMAASLTAGPRCCPASNGLRGLGTPRLG